MFTFFCLKAFSWLTQDWESFVNTAMDEFMKAYRVAPEDKIPVKTIGPQVDRK